MIDQVRVDEVLVGERARKDYGDLTSLMESISERGLLQPIGLAPGNHLLFGGRRLEACRRLGHVVIDVTRPATQDDALSLLKAERDENTCRKDMTPEELVDLGLRLEVMERAAAKARQAAGLLSGTAPRSAQVGGTGDPDPNAGRETREVVGEALGLSRNTYQRMKHVVQTARSDVERDDVREVAQDALQKMNAGETTPNAAYNAVRATRGEDGRKTRIANPLRKESPPAPNPQEPSLAMPQPPRYGGNRRKHLQVLDALNASLTGAAIVAAEIEDLDHTVTTEEAARLAGDLSNSIRALTRLKHILNRKATS